MHSIRRLLTGIGEVVARPAAFLLVAIYVAVWLWCDPESFDWKAGVEVSTLVMTLFITRTEQRDTQAIQAKLDELLRAEHRARTELTGLDRREPEEIEQHRARARSADPG